MPFYQNPFNSDFYGVLSLADRQHSPTFKVGPNTNDSFLMLAWNPPPYDLSLNTNLTINFSLYPDSIGIHRRYHSLIIDATSTAADVAAVTVSEIVTSLNSDSTFSSFFTAFADRNHMTGINQLKIKS